MRRGETAKYVQLLGNMGDLYRAFELFSGRLASQYGPSLNLLGVVVFCANRLAISCSQNVTVLAATLPITAVKIVFVPRQKSVKGLRVLTDR